MTKLLDRTSRPHSASLLKSFAVIVIGLALGLSLWTATAPLASAAQGITPKQMIEENLPQGKKIPTATKNELLAAVCAAIKKHPESAPPIVRVAAMARREWAKDIQQTAFRCTGDSDCLVLGRILRSMIDAVPDDAATFASMALNLAPGCAASFPVGNAAYDTANFGNAPGNQNPPPGSVGGGGGGQGNKVAICHNGHTIVVSPQGAEAHLRNHPGDRVGPCVVTPVTNR